MSARNYTSTRENINKIIDCLPDINRQKFGYKRFNQETPALPGSGTNGINRNINYSFEVQPYILEHIERVGTPYSDFFSDSETGTPDFLSEESDSSAGSVLRKNIEESSKVLVAEWERIERTIYDEEGEKVTRPLLVEECKQWRALHPQLRVIGKGISIPERKSSYRQLEHEEIIAIHYSDYEQFSESEERLSQSSTDVTPRNSPRSSAKEPRLVREKIPYNHSYNVDLDLPDNFCSLLQITPMTVRTPSVRKRQNSSILKSEISSSKWMRNSRPDSSVNSDRNSAKSYFSLDTRNYSNSLLSATERNSFNSNNTRVLTARQRESVKKLEPLYTPDVNTYDSRYNSLSYNKKKVSLPPLMIEEEKKKVGSAKRIPGSKRKGTSKCYAMERRQNC